MCCQRCIPSGCISLFPISISSSVQVSPAAHEHGAGDNCLSVEGFLMEQGHMIPLERLDDAGLLRKSP